MKGINKRIVEVRSLDSNRFERAIFFVRDRYAEESAKTLSDAAKQCLADEFRISGGRCFRRKFITALSCLLSAAAGSLFMLLIR